MVMVGAEGMRRLALAANFLMVGPLVYFDHATNKRTEVAPLRSGENNVAASSATFLRFDLRGRAVLAIDPMGPNHVHFRA
jgi:hypothetical protein